MMMLRTESDGGIASLPVFFKRPNPASFCLFSFFSQDKCSSNLNIIDKSNDGVLGT